MFRISCSQHHAALGVYSVARFSHPLFRVGVSGTAHLGCTIVSSDRWHATIVAEASSPIVSPIVDTDWLCDFPPRASMSRRFGSSASSNASRSRAQTMRCAADAGRRIAWSARRPMRLAGYRSIRSRVLPRRIGIRQVWTATALLIGHEPHTARDLVMLREPPAPLLARFTKKSLRLAHVHGVRGLRLHPLPHAFDRRRSARFTPTLRMRADRGRSTRPWDTIG